MRATGVGVRSRCLAARSRSSRAWLAALHSSRDRTELPIGGGGTRHNEAMFKYGDIAFGDSVRIVDTEATRGSGHARRSGVCYGITTPSVTGVDVVGPEDDVALNVHFEDDVVEDAWFGPSLVELVDHAAGTVATVGDHKFVKTAEGDWIEQPPSTGRGRRWFRRTT
jgi:hypothetical protein